jgi:hypothetical protein
VLQVWLFMVEFEFLELQLLILITNPFFEHCLLEYIQLHHLLTYILLVQLLLLNLAIFHTFLTKYQPLEQFSFLHYEECVLTHPRTHLFRLLKLLELKLMVLVAQVISLAIPPSQAPLLLVVHFPYQYLPNPNYQDLPSPRPLFLSNFQLNCWIHQH